MLEFIKRINPVTTSLAISGGLAILKLFEIITWPWLLVWMPAYIICGFAVLVFIFFFIYAFFTVIFRGIKNIFIFKKESDNEKKDVYKD